MAPQRAPFRLADARRWPLPHRAGACGPLAPGPWARSHFQAGADAAAPGPAPAGTGYTYRMPGILRRRGTALQTHCSTVTTARRPLDDRAHLDQPRYSGVRLLPAALAQKELLGLGRTPTARRVCEQSRATLLRPDLQYRLDQRPEASTSSRRAKSVVSPTMHSKCSRSYASGDATAKVGAP